MSGYTDMINAVETGILALVGEKLAGIFSLAGFGVEVDGTRTNLFPAILVSTDRFAFDRCAGTAYTVAPRTHVYVLFRSAAAQDKEKFKRHGVYPIVVGVARLLAGREFGCDITPLTPVQAAEIVSADLAERDIVCFDLQFAWDFEIEERDFDAEEAAALVAVANKWLIANNEIVNDSVTVKE